MMEDVTAQFGLRYMLCLLDCKIRVINIFEFRNTPSKVVSNMGDLIQKVHDSEPSSKFLESLVILHKHQVDGLPGEELNAVEVDHQSILDPSGNLFDPLDELFSGLQVYGTLQTDKQGTQPLIAGDIDIQGVGDSS